MRGRTLLLIAVFGGVIAAGFLLALVAGGLVADDADPSVEANEASAATPVSTTDPTPQLPEVALDLPDEEDTAALRSHLEGVGYVVSSDADTRISTPSHGARALEDTEAIEVLHRSWALVVHPRHRMLDLSEDDARALVEGREDAAGVLAATLEATRWLDRAYPVPNRFVQVAEPGAILGLIESDPTLVGLVPTEALDPRVRALTVDGFDPYRDAPGANPLAEWRHVSGPLAADVAAAMPSGAEGQTEDGAEDGADRPQGGPVGLLATGELIPARCVSAAVAGLEGGYDAIFEDTRDLIGAADLAVVHWEPAVIDGEPTPCTPTFNLSTRPEAAQAASDAGIDVALAVGNHMGDCWPGCGYQAAVLESVAHLEAAALTVVGAGADLEAARQPALVEVDGVTFAFLAYDDIAYQHYGATEDGAGTAHAELADVAQDVRAAAAQADHVVVGFSWGVEYVTAPTERQREFARAAVEAGASIVVGNHPHWVQATEWIGDAFVVYGLGNFVFDQDWSVETMQGAIIEAGFTADRLLGVRIRPTAVRSQYLVELLDPAREDEGGAEGAAILQRMWDASDALARP